MSMDNFSSPVWFLVLLATILMVILYRVLGNRHGHETKRDIEDMNQSMEEILKDIKEIVEEEKQKKAQNQRNNPTE